MPKISSEFDGNHKFPAKSFTGNSFGQPDVNGRYILWPKDGTETLRVPDTVLSTGPGGLLSKTTHYIAKVVFPHIRQKTFDYKKALENPIDLTNKNILRKIQGKINQIMTKLGVSYADRAGMVIPKNSVASAAWFIDDSTGKEGIAINPYWIIKSDLNALGRLIKKEVIHRALFRNLNELNNKEILNFTLDIISMRVVAQTPYDKLDKYTVELSEQLFNPKIYKLMPILALLDCSLTDGQAQKLPIHIYEIWASLYKPDDSGFLPPISELRPSSLYFKIKALMDQMTLEDLATNAGFGGKKSDGSDGKSGYPFNIKANQKIKDGGKSSTLKDETISPTPNKQSQNLDKNVRKSFIPKNKRYGDGFSNTLSSFWDKEVVHKKEFADETLQEFSRKWHTEKLLETVEGKIKDIIDHGKVRVEPYPNDLTDEGMLMAAVKISGPAPTGLIPFYFNHAPDEKNNVKKVMPFIDLSPSMQWSFPYIAKMIEDIEHQCDLTFQTTNKDGTLQRGAYGFAGDVREISETELEEMKKGNFKMGSSTSYQAVIEHTIEKSITEDIDTILCFTDGDSDVNQKAIDKFNSLNKKFHRIYFKMKDGPKKSGDITCSLDKLAGESFTLHLPMPETNG